MENSGMCLQLVDWLVALCSLSIDQLQTVSGLEEPDNPDLLSVDYVFCFKVLCGERIL
jgi:hypothetical protein